MSRFVKRTDVKFLPDPAQVITRFYNPGDQSKTASIIQKVDEMPDTAALLATNQLLREYAPRHKDLARVFLNHFNRIASLGLEKTAHFSEHKKILTGAYFTCEHSVMSTALYNPSIVESPDQTGLDNGYKRVIISLRATGSFHKSSIVFREGIIDNNNNLYLTPVNRLLNEPITEGCKSISRQKFISILQAMRLDDGIINQLAGMLEEEFNPQEVSAAAKRIQDAGQYSWTAGYALDAARWLADSYTIINFPLDSMLSERVILPISSQDHDGIEDPRFVKFIDDDGTQTYYATIHSWNGSSYIPRLLETRDFVRFTCRPLKGINMMNRGMALFPRKINGKYAMLGRLDGINNYVLFSNQIDEWEEGQLIQEPRYPWEFLQIGNCGSPIETAQGWLVITHGVGPMRRYCLSAILLDPENPAIIKGQLSEPLLYPHVEEMDGYMPNAVYSCGSILHNNQLIIPYSIGDTYSSIAQTPIEEVFHLMLSTGSQTDKSVTNDKQTRPRRILLVEDDIIQQKIAASLLRTNGYEVEIAGDGVVALIQLSKSNFDLVLSDVNMPNFDGIQLLEYLKQNNIDIPVMFLTSMNYEEIENKIKAYGIKEILNKPINRTLLLEKIGSLFQ
jgi:predicted GH43/DUF377 family glycosyl hydrolase